MLSIWQPNKLNKSDAKTFVKLKMKKTLGTRQKYSQVEKKRILSRPIFLSQLVYNVRHSIGSFFDESLIADVSSRILYFLPLLVRSAFRCRNDVSRSCDLALDFEGRIRRQWTESIVPDLLQSRKQQCHAMFFHPRSIVRIRRRIRKRVSSIDDDPEHAYE